MQIIMTKKKNECAVLICFSWSFSLAVILLSCQSTSCMCFIQQPPYICPVLMIPLNQIIINYLFTKKYE